MIYMEDDEILKKQVAGREQLGNLAPKLAELNDDVLFGEVWSREDELNLRDRSLITIAGLFGKGIVDGPFESHIRLGKEHGITQTEIVEVITHLAFYCGWPLAWKAFPIVQKVYDEE